MSGHTAYNKYFNKSMRRQQTQNSCAIWTSATILDGVQISAQNPHPRSTAGQKRTKQILSVQSHDFSENVQAHHFWTCPDCDKSLRPEKDVPLSVQWAWAEVPIPDTHSRRISYTIATWWDEAPFQSEHKREQNAQTQIELTRKGRDTALWRQYKSKERRNTSNWGKTKVKSKWNLKSSCTFWEGCSQELNQRRRAMTKIPAAVLAALEWKYERGHWMWLVINTEEDADNLSTEVLSYHRIPLQQKVQRLHQRVNRWLKMNNTKDKG